MFARQGVSLELFSIELASPKKYNLIPAFFFSKFRHPLRVKHASFLEIEAFKKEDYCASSCFIRLKPDEIEDMSCLAPHYHA